MLLQENGGLVRDLYTNIVNPFPRVPVQTLKPIALQLFDNLRTVSPQSNTQYILYGRYIIGTGDGTILNFVDSLFDLNARVWPSLVYEHGLVFVYNAALNANLQQTAGAPDSWFVVSKMTGDGSAAAYTQIDSPSPQIVQTHPTLTLGNGHAGISTSYTLTRTGAQTLVFSCTFSCLNEYSLNCPQTFLTLGGGDIFDVLSLALVDANNIRLAYNSVIAHVRQIPGTYNTLTCSMFDLHSAVPKMQITINGNEVYAGGFTTLDSFALAQGFGGLLTLTTVSASTISFVDICCLVPDIPIGDVSRLKYLTYASSLAAYFEPRGLAFTPNLARTNLVSPSTFASFAPLTSPFSLDTSGRPSLPPGQAFTSSWTQNQNALCINLAFYAIVNSSSRPSESTIFEWRDFSIRLLVDNTDPTHVLLTIVDTNNLSAALDLVNITNGVEMQITASINDSTNARLCSARVLSIRANGRSVSLISSASGAATNIVVCNRVVSSNPAVGLLSLRNLQVVQ